MGDLLSRLLEFRLHYTDQGILPRELAHRLGMDFQGFPSIYLAAADPLWVFLAHAAVAVALALGYRTRAMTVLAWYFQHSLRVRNLLVTNGGDAVLVSLLFWAIFLPWGARWSLDERRGEQPVSYRLAEACFVGQILLMYWVSWSSKLADAWLSGKAVEYALQSQLVARPSRLFLLEHPQWTTGLTYAVLLWEALGPLLLLTRFRRLAIFGFVLMHLSFGVFLRVGIFAFTPLLYLLALWPWPRADRAPLLAARAVNAMLAALFIYSVIVACANVGALPRPDLRLADWTGLTQRWGVFTGREPIPDGWIVVKAELADGARVDPFQGRVPFDWARPEGISPVHPHFRWSQAMLVLRSHAELRKAFLRAIVEDWNRTGPRIRRAELYWAPEGALLEEMEFSTVGDKSVEN